MKTTHPLVATFILATFTLSTASVHAQFNYETSNGTITITKYTGSGGAVVIPDRIDGLPVTSIGAQAFSGTGLTAITIPNSVTRIGAEALRDCGSLTATTIGNSVTSIGGMAFMGCVSLTSIMIPNSVTSIGLQAFFNCSRLTSITIGSSVTDIGGWAFSGCTNLAALTVDTSNPSYASLVGVLFNKSRSTLIQCPGGKVGSYTIPDSVTNIGDWAFEGCISLTSLTIGNSVNSIGDGAFAGCISLTSLTIGNSVTNIPYDGFNNCPSLSAITVDALNAVYSSVDGVVFDKSQTTLVLCPAGKAESYTIPDSVTSIGGGAFRFCTSLTSLTIGNSVISIGAQAFFSCGSLTNVTIGSSVTDIGNGAFQGCGSLTSVFFAGDAPSQAGPFCWWTWLSPGSFLCDPVTVYYLPGNTGWDTTFGGRPTAPWVLPYPVILTTVPNFGIQTNAFGFRISWATNASVVVETSSTAANPTWVPVSTNTLTDGWCYFSDAEWTNYPARFYRVRQW